jgi:hypothetical protein
MKTPTILVRLIGIYLLTTSTITLIQIGRMTTMQQAMQPKIPGIPSVNIPQNPMLDDMQIYGWIGIVVGLVAVAAAGFLARLLTFDADSRGGSDDFSDRLLRR